MRGGLLKICSSRMGAYSKGGLIRGFMVRVLLKRCPFKREDTCSCNRKDFEVSFNVAVYS